MTKYASLIDEQRIDITTQIAKLGLLQLEEGRPVEIVMCDNVSCPICGGPLEVYTSGKSYQISCNKDGRIRAVRAYSNAAFLTDL